MKRLLYLFFLLHFITGISGKLHACDPTSSSFKVTVCDYYILPGNPDTVRVSGSYVRVIENQAGCDSLVLVSVDIRQSITVYALTDINGLHADVPVSSMGVSYQWMDCDNQFQPIPGATDKDFLPPSPGNYAVLVDNGACVDTSACITFIPSSIHTADPYELQVYPNPGNTGFSVSGNQPLSVEVIGPDGKIVHHEGINEEHRINSQSWSEGVYVIRLHGDSGSYSKRIQIIH